MLDENQLISELEFKAIRSSGAGGQHVNKVASKVVLSFNIPESAVLSPDEKERLIQNLKSRLTQQQVLVLHCDDSRSQHANKKLVINRFLAMLQEALKVQKKRKPTKIPKSVIKKRLKSKRLRSDIKSTRRKPNIE